MIAETARLHITPLNPDLLSVIVGPLLESVSQTVSYHNLQTFPQNSYGYIELPTMEAEKIKKKLNGAILKGKKIKIEDARPSKRRANADPEPESVEETPRRTKKVKKAKADEDTLDGREISPDRKVKRGWTQTLADKQVKEKKSKHKRPKSEYTEKEELLFRTQVSPNKEENSKTTRSKKKGKGRERVVHEFEKSTPQPSFLKNDVEGTQRTTEYVDGKGWLDKEGNVLEPEPKRSRRKQKPHDEEQARSIDKASVQAEQVPELSDKEKEDEELQDVSDQDDAEEQNEDDESTPIPDTPNVEAATPSTSPGEVHPLEALFKKPVKRSSQDVAKPSLEIQTSFSFFGGGNKDELEEEEESFQVPLTPFSSQDQRSRITRSAAPTPDTAHPSRFGSYERSESAEADNADAGEAARRLEINTEANGSTESDFAKKFWEKRGENNRAWKARRRTVLKEKRQRENRATRPRNW